MKTKKQSEYDKFDRTMRGLISVPSSEIRAKLDAEKKAKERKKAKKASASREAV